jgi:transcriptional regulator with XRE-family HTH domain
MNVGKSLKVALAVKGMRQTELANKLGLTRQWISRLANSNSASMETVCMLAGAIGMQVSEFIALGED